MNHVLLLQRFSLSIHLNGWTVLFLDLIILHLLNLSMDESYTLTRNVIIESNILRWFDLVNTWIWCTYTKLINITCFLSWVQILLLGSHYLLLIEGSIKIWLGHASWIWCHFIIWSDLTRLYRIYCLAAKFALICRVWCSRIHGCTLRLWSLLLIHIDAEIFILRLLWLIDILSSITSGRIIKHKRIAQSILFNAITRRKWASVIHNLLMVLR